MIQATRIVTAQDVRGHYDDLDILYREIWGQHLHHGLWHTGQETKDQATHQLIDRMAKIGAFKPKSRICDIGCGYGGTAQVLAENLGADVTGVTITPRQYERARMIRPSSGRLEFFLEDWLHNSLPSSSFDHAIAIESSEHAVDKYLYFKQAARVLKPSGSITLCAWMENENATALERKYLLTPICDEGRLPSLLTESNYKFVLRNAGFEVTYSEELTDRVKKTWTLVILGVIKYLLTHPFDFVNTIRSLTRNRDFFWTPLRMRIAFETKALRYVLMHARKQ